MKVKLVANSRNICTFQNASRSLLMFCKMSQARQGLAQRPHREWGDLTGELVITWKGLSPVGHSWTSFRFGCWGRHPWLWDLNDSWLTYLNFKSPYYFTEDIILYCFLGQKSHIANHISLTQVLASFFNHLLSKTFYHLTQLWLIVVFPWFFLEITVAQYSVTVTTLSRSSSKKGSSIQLR